MLALYEETDRDVWVADSFSGLPEPDGFRYPADAGDKHFTMTGLAVSIDEVRRNFEKYGLLDDRVRFLPGWFRDTLPDAPVERLAVLRLDGDMYESTLVALRALYPKVSVGGYVIVDDYGALESCRTAVNDFREDQGIVEELVCMRAVLHTRASAPAEGAPRLLRKLTARLNGFMTAGQRPEARRRLDELSASGILSLGRHTYGCPDVRSYPGDTARIVIGAFVSIADDVTMFVGGNHPVDWVSTFPLRAAFHLPGALDDGCPASKGDVVVGHDVWIGAGATILSGVHVGNGAVIGAEAVVAKDVRPYAIVVGNPAQEVRRRFGDDEIECLERIAWWDWPLEQILANVSLLSNPDVGAFLARFSGGQ